MNNFISLFTGAGGLDWGFHENGNFQLIVSNEILEPHLKTYTDHYKIPLKSIEDGNKDTNIGICGDIHELEIDHSADVVTGGPPCQDFSLLRGSDKREGVKVKRGKLYQQFLRIIETSKPKVFVMENVPGMLSANEGLAYQTIQEDFINEGYELIYENVVNISNLGAPQARKRLIVIAVQKNLIKNNKKELEEIAQKNLNNPLLEKYPLTPLEVFEGDILTNLEDKYVKIIKEYKDSTKNIDNPEAKKWIEEYKTLKFNIIEDYIQANKIDNYDEKEFQKAMNEHKKTLKILDYYQKPINEQQFHDETNKLPKRNRKVQERMYHIPPSYNFKAVENTEWKVKGLMSNIYRRIHPLKPSPTIIAYGGGGTGGYHYEYKRQGLTNRERARLQTFPDNYLFNGKTTEIRAQIGEAVPPIASYYIAKTVEEILNKL